MIGKWIVHTKGGAATRRWEIAVIREDNEHGLKSFGWFDKNKLLISHNGGPGDWQVTELIWDRLVAVATDVAEIMNERD